MSDPTPQSPPAPAPTTTNNPTEALSGRSAIFFALFMSCAAGFILCGYEMFRSTANTLFMTTYGKGQQPRLFGLIPLSLPLVMGMVPIGVTLALYVYGRLLSWLGPRRTLRFTTLGAMATLLVCYLGVRAGIKPLRGVLFVFKESYVVLLIEQLWSFINSRLSKEWARRLNGPICGVAGLGAMAGGEILYRMSASWGTLHMLPIAALVTLPGLVIAELAYRRYGEPRGDSKPHSTAGYLGLNLFRQQRILVVLLGLVICAQLIAAFGEQIFLRSLSEELPQPDRQNAYSGRFYVTVNFVAMLGQFVLSPLALRFLPLPALHVIIPSIHIAAFSYFLFSPSLARAQLAYLLFKSIDYSLFRAAKELLYVPLSFDVRYRGKEIIDVLGYRFSKGAASLSIWACQTAGVILPNPALAGLCIFGALLWLALVIPLARTREARSP